jgi:hypothetical protein
MYAPRDLLGTLMAVYRQAQVKILTVHLWELLCLEAEAVDWIRECIYAY